MRGPNPTPFRGKYKRWLRTFSPKPSLMTVDQVRVFVERFTLPHCVFGTPKFRVERALTVFGPARDAVELHFRWHAPNSDPLWAEPGAVVPVQIGTSLPLPTSEYEVAETVLDFVRGGYEHEFEETFRFDGRQVLNPHDRPELDPDVVDVKETRIDEPIKFNLEQKPPPLTVEQFEKLSRLIERESR